MSESRIGIGVSASQASLHLPPLSFAWQQHVVGKRWEKKRYRLKAAFIFNKLLYTKD